MKTIFETFTDKVFHFEKEFVPVFFAISVFLSSMAILYNQQSSSYIWALFLMFISLIHLIGIKTEKILFRLIGSWFSFIIWAWLGLSTLNTFLYVSAFCIGISNIIIFISISNRIEFDWISLK